MPDTFKTNDTLVKGGEQIVNEFNTIFANIGKELKNTIGHSNRNPFNYVPNFSGSSLHTLADTNEEEVIKIVENLRNVGAGNDKINSRIFKATYRYIIAEIVHFLNLCLQHGTFPCSLKRAVIKPIFKAGDKQHFSNYRPISLLPVISKLLEKTNLFSLGWSFD